MKEVFKKIAPYVAAGWLFAQSIINGQNITGRIIEKGTNNYGIKNATVQVYSNNVKTPDITTTDNNGNFNIMLTDVLETTQELTGAFSGYNQLRIKTPINGKGKLTLYNILGQETLKQEINGIGGVQEITIPTTRLANGVYVYKIEDETGIQTPKKFTVCDGYVNPGKSGIQKTYITNTTNGKLSKTTGTWKIDSINVSGQNIETIVEKNYQPQTGNSYNVGTIEAEGKNNIYGDTYDLDTKYTTKTGVRGSNVYLKSTPEKKVLTDANGHFNLKTAHTENDTLIIENNTYYNWKHPITISSNTPITAFNDNTGIPTIKRCFDNTTSAEYDNVGTNKRDLIEFTQKITNITSSWLNDNVYKNTKPRFKNKIVNVFLNRNKAPNSWYPDSAMSGLKHLENEQLKFVETTDSASAQMHIFYDNPNVGNGVNTVYDFDEAGPYLKVWDISFRGNKDYNGGTQIPLNQDELPYIAAHEGKHALFTSGEHSAFVSDLLFGDVNWRYNVGGYRDFGSEKERKAKNILFLLERNPKLLEYSK